jgi:hypothetical protein
MTNFDKIYLVDLYEGCKTAYDSKDVARMALLKAYVKAMCNWSNLTADDVRTDLKSFLDNDWIEDFGEVDTLGFIRSEQE